MCGGTTWEELPSGEEKLLDDRTWSQGPDGDEMGETRVEVDVVATFVEKAPELIGQLESALQTGDTEAAKRAAHTLKGSARSIGANDLGMVCQEIEYAIKEGQSPNPAIVLIHFKKLEQATEAYFAKKAA